ncbi:hypothetical protein E1B28_001655 [Marasmius oreades]|uniref:Uncharacterized protein n=1 Tax=Marasmius oreades TaxID=181124 RepID=A0A9P7V3X5_9AGAR|nr:uncharacterized protein E1B28_001655 [Marasmius oreades]KAG7099848.1 hypothetical protein E1B28_001655 [Marasmius oreades]
MYMDPVSSEPPVIDLRQYILSAASDQVQIDSVDTTNVCPKTTSIKGKPASYSTLTGTFAVQPSEFHPNFKTKSSGEGEEPHQSSTNVTDLWCLNFHEDNQEALTCSWDILGRGQES